MAAIFIVDDSKFMRKLLSDILTKEGHDIVGEAENAKEALELWEKLDPDVVTMDIIMPEVDEVNAISALKTMVKSKPETKVIMVSAMGQEIVVSRFIQAGAKDFITKPFESSQITAVVERVSKED